MKKLGLIILISLCSMTVKAVSRGSAYMGCLHGRYFIAKYDANGNLTEYGFGLDCKEPWVMQIYMVAGSITPTGVEFDHPTEDRINGMTIQNFHKPEGEIEAKEIDEQVKTNEGQHVYVNSEALNPDIRKFLFES